MRSKMATLPICSDARSGSLAFLNLAYRIPKNSRVTVFPRQFKKFWKKSFFATLGVNFLCEEYLIYNVLFLKRSYFGGRKRDTLFVKEVATESCGSDALKFVILIISVFLGNLVNFETAVSPPPLLLDAVSRFSTRPILC